MEPKLPDAGAKNRLSEPEPDQFTVPELVSCPINVVGCAERIFITALLAIVIELPPDNVEDP